MGESWLLETGGYGEAVLPDVLKALEGLRSKVWNIKLHTHPEKRKPSTIYSQCLIRRIFNDYSVIFMCNNVKLQFDNFYFKRISINQSKILEVLLDV